MGQTEVDPLQRAYAALALAIIWHKPLDSEAAFRIADDVVTVKRATAITPEIISEAKQIILTQSAASFNSFIKKYRINKYTILKEIGNEFFGEENFTPDEGVISVLNTAEILKRMNRNLKDLQENTIHCNGSNCDKCPLDMEIGDSMTLCEWVMDIEFNDKGVPIKRTSLAVPLIKYDEILQGSTTARRVRLYVNIENIIRKYLENHKTEKMQIIINKALLDYIEKRKRIEENMSRE